MGRYVATAYKDDALRAVSYTVGGPIEVIDISWPYPKTGKRHRSPELIPVIRFSLQANQRLGRFCKRASEANYDIK